MEAYMGLICGWAPNFAPRGWAFCQGQLLSIAQNSALFALLGTTYGGNGQTTFGLPDLRGRVAIAPGQAPGIGTYTIGEMGGINQVTITTAQMPMHTHSAVPSLTGQLSATTNTATATAPGNGEILAAPNGQDSSLRSVTVKSYAPASAANTTLQGGPVTGTITVGPAGGSQPLPIMQPYLAIPQIICLQGIFPSRN